MSQPQVKSKWGSEKDKAPAMTKAAHEAAEYLEDSMSEMTSKEKKLITDTLQWLYDCRMKAGNQRIMTLTIPRVLIHMTNPDNK